MTFLDWLIVIILNGAIIFYAIFKGRDTKTSEDWFLARRSLPWWIVGLSMYATAIDASDMVADSGGAYSLGMSMFVVNWVGTVVGWILMSHFIAIPMYRAGMYTNAEYLEARFTPSARVISAVIQVLYRTVVMGIIGTTVFLTLEIVAGWEKQTAWVAVVIIASVATVYTVIGGLRSVAITDALQAFIMLVASVVLFLVVFSQVGGWTGIEQKLNQKDPQLAKSMLHVGHDFVESEDLSALSDSQKSAVVSLGGEFDLATQTVTRTTPAWVAAISFIIAGMAYSIVNHTQAMRMLGSRSEWDLRMSVSVAGSVMILVTFLNLSMGIMGRALYDLPSGETDHVFPKIVHDHVGAGLKGLVVAGIIAASFSTYDSIGSTLSALLTRDVYGRFLVRDKDDAHYLAVGRWLTPLIIFGSFVYVPLLLRSGMFMFYLEIVGAFVVPLLTIYLMGAMTRVHRSSATIGLAVGVSYGVLTLIARPIATTWGVAILIPPFSVTKAVALISMLLTAGAMVANSLIRGWEAKHELASADHSGWLQASRKQIQKTSTTEQKSIVLPTFLGLVIASLGILLSFFVFW